MIVVMRAIAQVCLVAFLSAGAMNPAFADFGKPKPKIDCKKPENKNKPACKPKVGRATDDEIYHAAYWMAREGRYAAALDILAMAQHQDDPRILNATGFATRKLGHVDAALPFYHRALQRDPGYVLAREYLGEAYLAKGDLAAAIDQLTAIEARCGRSCTAYIHLAGYIDAFKAGQRERG